MPILHYKLGLFDYLPTLSDRHNPSVNGSDLHINRFGRPIRVNGSKYSSVTPSNNTQHIPLLAALTMGDVLNLMKTNAVKTTIPIPIHAIVMITLITVSSHFM